MKCEYAISRISTVYTIHCTILLFLFNGYVPQICQKNKSAFMPVLFLILIWPRDSLYYQISLFLSIFWTFEAALRGLFMLKKCLKILFCSKYTQKLPKNSNVLQFVWMTMGVLSPPQTTMHRAVVKTHLAFILYPSTGFCTFCLNLSIYHAIGYNLR